jgi:hypothetical protein
MSIETPEEQFAVVNQIGMNFIVLICVISLRWEKFVAHICPRIKLKYTS